MILANVYYGAKKWEYELNFNSDFTKITHGLLSQYDEKDELVKIDSLLGFDQCYELQRYDSPDKNKIHPSSYIQHKIYHNISQENNPSSSKSIAQKNQIEEKKKKDESIGPTIHEIFDELYGESRSIDESIDKSIDESIDE